MTFAKPVSILGGVRTVMRGKERERARLCTIQLSYNMARRRELLRPIVFQGGSGQHQQPLFYLFDNSGSDTRRERTVRSVRKGQSVLFHHYRSRNVGW